MNKDVMHTTQTDFNTKTTISNPPISDEKLSQKPTKIEKVERTEIRTEKNERKKTHYLPLFPSKPHPKQQKASTETVSKSQSVLRDFQNYQASQQAIFIALLSLTNNVSIGKPLKKSSVTRQFIRVVVVESADTHQRIEIEKEVEKRCLEKRRIDINNGVSEKTSARRFKTNKRAESMNILIEELRKVGYVFESRLTEGKKDTIKLETVYKVTKKDSGPCFDSEEIEKIGEDINKYLYSLVSHSNENVIVHDNKELKKLIGVDVDDETEETTELTTNQPQNPPQPPTNLH
ncbi:hypothetical protein EIN_318610 [Entamoeba invadens IP1]|uniref:Uncharacterized protein n=1 Tax=Entamoeba invadens IP1 TaxID=370355 RepID=A0A0A1TZJ1_ENTIV|nr:hypothetical protein EIN_318610 [Entamoeba invadens IP1]ELP87002.1 hypothetical protein EIN_318610 [Entamoeba invadens IP1]|eukprot:XP_004253773.1 hypothetical protein EIN_318610 [Entamoeba invadens IP1]